MYQDLGPIVEGVADDVGVRIKAIPKPYRDCIDLLRGKDFVACTLRITELGERSLDETRARNAFEEEMHQQVASLEKHLQEAREAVTTTQEQLAERTKEVQYSASALLERDRELTRLRLQLEEDRSMSERMSTEALQRKDIEIETLKQELEKSKQTAQELKKNMQTMETLELQAAAIMEKCERVLTERDNYRAALVMKDKRIAELDALVLDLEEKSLRENRERTQERTVEQLQRLVHNSVSVGTDTPLEKSVRFSRNVEVVEEREGVIERSEQVLKNRGRQMGAVPILHNISSGDLEVFSASPSDESDSNDISKEQIHHKPVSTSTQTISVGSTPKLVQVDNTDEADTILELKRVLLGKLREIYRLKVCLGVTDVGVTDIATANIFDQDNLDRMIHECRANGLFAPDPSLMAAVQNLRTPPPPGPLSDPEGTSVYTSCKALLSLAPITIPDSLWEIRCQQAMMRQGDLEAELVRLRATNQKLCEDIRDIVLEQDQAYSSASSTTSRSGRRDFTTHQMSSRSVLAEDGAHLATIWKNATDTKQAVEFFYLAAVRYRRLYELAITKYRMGRVTEVPIVTSSRADLSNLISTLSATRNRAISLAERLDEATYRIELLQKQVDSHQRLNIQDLTALQEDEIPEGLHARCLVAESLVRAYSSMLTKGHGLRCKELEESLRLFNEENDLILKQNLLDTNHVTRRSASECGEQAVAAGFELLKKCTEMFLHDEADYQICMRLATILESETPAEYARRLGTLGIVNLSKPTGTGPHLPAVEQARQLSTTAQAIGSGGTVLIKTSDRLCTELQACLNDSKAFSQSRGDDARAELKAAKTRIIALKSRVSSLCDVIGELLISCHADPQGPKQNLTEVLGESISTVGAPNSMLVLISSKRLVAACERRIETLEQMNTELSDRVWHEITRTNMKLAAVRFICCKKDKVRASLSNIRSVYERTLHSFRTERQALLSKINALTADNKRLAQELTELTSSRVTERTAREVQCSLLDSEEVERLEKEFRSLTQSNMHLVEQMSTQKAELSQMQGKKAELQEMKARLQKLYHVYTGLTESSRAAIEAFSNDMLASIAAYQQQPQTASPVGDETLTCGRRVFELIDNISERLERFGGKVHLLEEGIGALKRKATNSPSDNAQSQYTQLTIRPTREPVKGSGVYLMLSNDSDGTEKDRGSALSLSELALSRSSGMNISKIHDAMRTKIKTLQQELHAAQLQLAERSSLSHVSKSQQTETSQLDTSLRIEKTTRTVGAQTLLVSSMYSGTQTDLYHYDVIERPVYEGLRHELQTYTSATSFGGTRSMPPDVALPDPEPPFIIPSTPPILDSTHPTLVPNEIADVMSDLDASPYMKVIRQSGTRAVVSMDHMEETHCTQCAALREELAAEKMAVSNLQIQLQRSDEELLEARNMLRLAEKALDAKTESFLALERQLRDERLANTKYAKQVEELQKRDIVLALELDKAQAAFKEDCLRSVSRKDARLKQAQKNLDEVVEANKRLQSKVKGLNSELLRIKREIEIQQTMRKNSERNTNADKDMARELAVAKSRIKILSAELRSLRQVRPRSATQTSPRMTSSDLGTLQFSPPRPSSAGTYGSQKKIGSKTSTRSPRPNSAGAMGIPPRRPLSPSLQPLLQGLAYADDPAARDYWLHLREPDNMGSGLVLEEADRLLLLNALSDEDISAIMSK
ncbi:hypothetical protein GMRT_13513 [Giardia muris]|uniref:Coiled-coil protein n=1 Tax=Giardia muris TaxID=5742 RepID=A0A4Z1SQ60_GIAMU|nr:hypothetical protein GMRT_13513 [Giardia muris]|eukprot:TNJ27974.1 hypothetical protein GMRT_13513 [Giardia muris]